MQPRTGPAEGERSQKLMLGRFRKAGDGPRLLLFALLGAQLIAGLIWLNLDDAGPPPWDEAVFLNNGAGYCTNEVAGNPVEYLGTSTFYPPGVPWSSCLLYALL